MNNETWEDKVILAHGKSQRPYRFADDYDNAQEQNAASRQAISEFALSAIKARELEIVEAIEDAKTDEDGHDATLKHIWNNALSEAINLITSSEKGEQSAKASVTPKKTGLANGCGICGGAMSIIRGRYPKDDKRKVCPTCLAERMDSIHEQTSKDYGRTYNAVSEERSDESSALSNQPSQEEKK